MTGRSGLSRPVPSSLHLPRVGPIVGSASVQTSGARAVEGPRAKGRGARLPRGSRPACAATGYSRERQRPSTRPRRADRNPCATRRRPPRTPQERGPTRSEQRPIAPPLKGDRCRRPWRVTDRPFLPPAPASVRGVWGRCRAPGAGRPFAIGSVRAAGEPGTPAGAGAGRGWAGARSEGRTSRPVWLPWALWGRGGAFRS